MNAKVFSAAYGRCVDMQKRQLSPFIKVWDLLCMQGFITRAGLLVDAPSSAPHQAVTRQEANIVHDTSPLLCHEGIHPGDNVG